jgi:hypothetical protein
VPSLGINNPSDDAKKRQQAFLAPLPGINNPGANAKKCK